MSHVGLVPYSHWFADAIKDEELARESRGIENDRALSANDSRARIKDLVDRRYTAPATKDQS